MSSRRFATQNWTHPSVIAMAEGKNAVDVIIGRARQVALRAIDSGWAGPPYDPFQLAELLGIGIVARDDIRDARVVPLGAPSQFQIEYNPNRPTHRVRFSLAHEIAHTLFPDCGKIVRNRAARHEFSGDEWQLEMLCNIAASELLMPDSTFATLAEKRPLIDELMGLRVTFDVSTEALLLRYARTTRHACFVFAASRVEDTEQSGPYRIDYAVPAASWQPGVTSGSDLTDSTLVRQCTAVDYTAKGDERWPGCSEPFHIEAIGVPPYPTGSLPRVVGVGSPLSDQPDERDLLTFVTGDATEPRGSGNRIIVHIVNDAAVRWGGAFAGSVGAKWPHVAADFTDWAQVDSRHLALGSCHVARATTDITVVSMVAQHGYGPSTKPRVRYAALETCLTTVAALAQQSNPPCTVNMPKIGTGQAGGRWALVEEIVRDTLVQADVPVMVYDLPKKGKPETKERGLFD